MFLLPSNALIDLMACPYFLAIDIPLSRADVVAQLVEQLLPTPEVPGLQPIYFSEHASNGI